ncbi:MAG: uracil-DNA glycosylase [Nanoarchaeota archaeon]
MLFEELKKECSSCSRCVKLCQSRTQVVFGSGSPNAEILFIGEAPGAEEDKQGVPFCGMSGKVLSELLSSAGFSRKDIFITNTLLCRPENNRNPAKEEVENCRERLDKLIEIMQPKVIVTIGNFATERILGKTGIKSLRGKVFSALINKKEVKVVPVIHPASYLYSGRNPQMYEDMKNDFRLIAEVVKKSRGQKNLRDFRLFIKYVILLN